MVIGLVDDDCIVFAEFWEGTDGISVAVSIDWLVIMFFGCVF